MHSSSFHSIEGYAYRLIKCFCLALVLAASAGAQPNGSPDEEPSSPATIEESPLTTFAFRDEEGNLVEMPNFKFSDFEKAYRLLRGLTQQDPRPRFSIQWLSLVGEATSNHAEMLLTARVLLRDQHWVRVPLRFNQAMVQEPLEVSDEVEAFLHPEAQGDGYVCYIRGKPDQQHTLKLKLLVPLASVSTVGDRTRLALRLPRATASELKLKIPMGEVEAEVSEGATLLPLTSAEGATELTVLGVGGDFQLTWHKPDADAATMPVVLQADGAIAARMDGQTVTWNTTISVRSFGAPFDRFQLRLPLGSQLVPASSTGYRVTPVESQDAESALGQMVEVRLDTKTSGPVEVRLAARRAVEEEAPEAWVDIAGFTVINAVRQWGHLAVTVPSDWQVLWGPQRGVNRVDQLPEPLRKDDVVAGFEYSTQPALLSARLVPRTSRTSVHPEYVVLVGAERVDLRARLRYSIRGAKVFALRADLPGWHLDGVEPDNLVALDGVEINEDGNLHVPLLQPMRGELEIVVLAHRETVPAVAKGEPVPLELALPRPQADTTGPALVVVVPDDNMEVVSDPSKTSGLVRQRSAPTVELPARQQPSLCFRAEMPDAVLRAQVQRLPRRIEVNTSSELSLKSAVARVAQRFDYVILHEPVDRLLLEVPKALATDKSFEVMHEGVAVSVRPFADDAHESEGPNIILQAELQEPCIGRCELALSYAVTLPPLPEDEHLSVSVPLAAPRDAVPGVNRLSFAELIDLSAEITDDLWSSSDSAARLRPPASETTVFTSRGRCNQVRLQIGPPDIQRLGATVVERSWVQTWLIRTDQFDRQDRAVFRVCSNRKELAVRLPRGTAMEQVFVWLNMERLEEFAVDENRLYIPLPADGAPRTHHLELGYHFLEPMDRGGPLSVELPLVDDAVWVRRMYWQLVLPRHEHVVVPPDGFTSESLWNWNGYVFAREPLMEQPELERWSGAAERTPVSQETNRYLFSTSGHPRDATLRTADRSWIVLGASGLALVAGLILIYVPAGRHPATLFVLAIGLAGSGILYPAPTLLIAQAASLGLGLTLLAGLLERGVARRRIVPPSPGAQSEFGGDSTLTQHEAARVGDPTTTQTAAIGVGPKLQQDAFP